MDKKPEGGLTSTLRLTVSIAVSLVAGLAILLVFDVIPDDIFSEGVQKIGLLVIIVGLASAAVTLISKIGK